MQSVYLTIMIAVQVVGFGIIIFKGGKYIGESNQMFKQLFLNDKSKEKKLAEHDESIIQIQNSLAYEAGKASAAKSHGRT